MVHSIVLHGPEGTTTGEVSSGNVLGRLAFAANEAGGGYGKAITAKIEAKSEEAFDTDDNQTKFVFFLAGQADSGAATEKMSLSSAGNLTIAGDLTISGDDLTMATNTSGAALIADGTNFNPVVIAGDIAIGTDGTATIQANSVDGTMIALGSDDTGDIMYYDGTNYVRLAAAQDGYILTATGAGAAPAWEAAAGGGASDLNDLGDVSFGGTNLTRSLLINYKPGSAPQTGTLGSDCSYNLAIGYQALNSITDSQSNVALGRRALTALTTNNECVAIGSYAGYANTAGYATFLGPQAGRAHTTGAYPVYIGYGAGYMSTTGGYNVGVGYDALKGAWSSGNDGNTAIGAAALRGITTGGYNSAIGGYAGTATTTGSYNIYIGYSVGGDNTTLSNLLFIGDGSEGNNGTLIKGDMANKFLAIGKADVTLATEDATLQVYPDGTNDAAYFAKMPPSHAGDLIRIDNSLGTNLFKVDKDGDITIAGTIAGTLADGVVATTQSSSDNSTKVATTAYADAAGGGGGASDLNDLGDVSFGGTNLTRSLLINAAPGSSPTTGTLGSDCSYNLAIGYQALNSITGSVGSVALGVSALTALTTGGYSVAIGYAPLSKLTIGQTNVAIGYNAGGEGTEISNCVFIGNIAGYYVDDGDYNVALGYGALKGKSGVTNCSQNIAIGLSPLEEITTGLYNIALGSSACLNVTDGDYNIAIGKDAMKGTSSATTIGNDFNIAIGSSALLKIKTGDYNTGIGRSALQQITTGSQNIAVGRNAGYMLTTGGNNIMIGYNAGWLIATTQGNMLCIGLSAGESATGSLGVTIGPYAGQKNTADYATFLGGYAGKEHTSGSYPTYVGHYAGYYSTDGDNNVAVGYNALRGASGGNTTGNDGNTAIGVSALAAITTGQSNTAIGIYAGDSITTANYNIAIGYFAGSDNTTAWNLLFIGNNPEGSNGTLIKGDMSNKFLAIGKADVDLSTEAATLQVYPKTTTDVGMLVVGQPSQASDLLQLKNSDGNTLFVVDAIGQVGIGDSVDPGTRALLHISGGTTDGNKIVVFEAGSTGGGDTNNQAILKVVAGTSANAQIQMGHGTAASTLNGGLKYKSDDTLVLRANNTDVLAIDSSKVVDFKIGEHADAMGTLTGATNDSFQNIYLEVKVGGYQYYLRLYEAGGM